MVYFLCASALFSFLSSEKKGCDLCQKVLLSMEQPHDFSERVLKDTSSAVLVLDQKGLIVYVNRPASVMLETGNDPEGQRFALFAEDSSNDRFHEVVLSALYDKNDTMVEKVPFTAPSGKKYVFRMSCSYLQNRGPDDAELVITLADETEAEETKLKLRDSSRTFVMFLFAFCGWMLFYALWEFLKRPFSADYMTHGVEVLGIIMLIYILRETSFTWRDLGGVTYRPWETVRTALIVSACAFVFLCIVKAVARLFVPTAFEPQAPFFDISRFGLRQILYVFTAGIQEFLARSVMQANLKRIIDSPHSTALAIILSSLIFAALHIHLGFVFMIGAAVLASLEGILYEKQQNLLGVWIIHWVFGVSGTLLCLIDH